MSTLKTMSTVGLALLASAALAAPATLQLTTGGAPAMAGAANTETKAVGAVQVIGVPSTNIASDGGLIGATIDLTFDPAILSLASADITYPNADWAAVGTPSISNGRLFLVLANGTDTGQTTTGPIVTINFHHNGANAKKLQGVPLALGGLSEADDIAPHTVTATAAFLPGATKSLGTTISGAPSTGPGGLIAVVADNTLRVVKAADLSDAFTGVALGNPINGRPSFGVVGGAQVVAVGDQGGKVTVVNSTSGAAATGSPFTVGSKAGTPAIDSTTGNIYVGANQTAGAPALVKIGTSGTTNTTLTGTNITADVAFIGGGVAVGTDAALQLFRDGGTGPLVQQAIINDGAQSSPIIRGDGLGLVATAAAGGTIYEFNAITGTVAPQSLSGLPAGSSPLSEPWYDATSDTVIYGTATGSLVNVKFGPITGGPAAGTPPTVALLSNPINAEPITIGTTTYAVDTTGNLKGTDGTSLSLGAPASKAIAATGRTAGTDSLVLGLTNGTITVLPF